jgi:hypothetical protein
MATFQSARTVSVIAGSAISPYRFVVQATNDSKYDHVGTAQTRMDGISAEGVAADGNVFPMVVPDGSFVKVEAGATLAVGDLIASDNTGKAIVHVSTAGNYIAGVCLKAAASGDIAEIQFIRDRDQA